MIVNSRYIFETIISNMSFLDLLSVKLHLVSGVDSLLFHHNKVSKAIVVIIEGVLVEVGILQDTRLVDVADTRLADVGHLFFLVVHKLGPGVVVRDMVNVALELRLEIVIQCISTCGTTVLLLFRLLFFLFRMRRFDITLNFTEFLKGLSLFLNVGWIFPVIPITTH